MQSRHSLNSLHTLPNSFNTHKLDSTFQHKWWKLYWYDVEHLQSFLKRWTISVTIKVQTLHNIFIQKTKFCQQSSLIVCIFLRNGGFQDRYHGNLPRHDPEVSDGKNGASCLLRIYIRARPHVYISRCQYTRKHFLISGIGWKLLNQVSVWHLLFSLMCFMTVNT